MTRNKYPVCHRPALLLNGHGWLIAMCLQKCVLLGNFQIFDRSGQLLLFVGDRSETPAPAKFMLPAGLAIDEDDRVYLVDQFFRKIDVFRPAALKPSEGYFGSRIVNTP